MPGHANPFPGCGYGPMALRPLLRHSLQPGERTLGFGAADTAAPGWRTLMLLAPAMPVGGVWSSRLLRRRRVLVLSDRRLLVLPPDRPVLDRRSNRWNAEFALSQITLAIRGPRTVEIRWEGGLFVARLRGRWSGAALSTTHPGLADTENAR